MTRISEADYARIVAQQQRPARQAATLPAPSEAQEQEAVITWARCNANRLPGLDLLFHIPNGEARPTAAGRRLKAQGVQPGVPDLFLPVTCGRFHGLWIEMKRADRSNHPTPLQAAWIERLRQNGYLVVVAYGADEAIAAIAHYLSVE